MVRNSTSGRGQLGDAGGPRDGGRHGLSASLRGNTRWQPRGAATMPANSDAARKGVRCHAARVAPPSGVRAPRPPGRIERDHGRPPAVGMSPWATTGGSRDRRSRINDSELSASAEVIESRAIKSLRPAPHIFAQCSSVGRVRRRFRYLQQRIVPGSPNSAPPSRRSGYAGALQLDTS